MLVRICNNGHQVPQDDLKACPSCGVSLSNATTREVEDVDAPQTGGSSSLEDPYADPAPRVPAVVGQIGSGLPLLAVGAVLALLGWLAAASSDGGTAQGGSVILLGIGGILTSIGVIAIGVKIGVQEAHQP
ncbi:MAG: hypothetical protein L0H93_16685 [Nocardioides sp.]|nr:hypothetical protein [Nocardioides sp.]